MSHLSLEMQCRIIAHLVDGNSLRATSRLTGVHQDTIGRLALAVGEGCIQLHARHFHHLPCSLLEFDEQWGWVAKKQKNVTDASPAEHGDAWTFVAMDVASRATVSWLVGKRTLDNARWFVFDVRQRVIGAPMIASDGFKPYVDAIEEWFPEASYGQLVKQYAGDGTPGARDGHYKGAMPVVVRPGIDERAINTSLIERQNLETRMNLRRMARRTNAFSKKLRNHSAAIALHYTYSNFCKVISTLRVTPAIQIGVSRHVWSIAELVQEALAAPPVDPMSDEGAPLPSPSVGPGERPRLMLIHGGA